MKKMIEKIIKNRNPNFRFHEDVDTVTVLFFVWENFWNLLRGLSWLMYGKNPKMALTGKGVKYFNAHKIRFGKFMKLGDYVYMSAMGKQGIILGDGVGIGAFSRLVVSTSLDNPGAYIKLGNNVGVGEFAYMGGGGGLEIGDECIIGQYFSCHPENHNSDRGDRSIRHQGVTRKGIKIGQNCWIGSQVTILDGVSVGEGSVIAAGAVVTQSFPPNVVIGGVPAKILRSRI